MSIAPKRNRCESAWLIWPPPVILEVVPPALIKVGVLHVPAGINHGDERGASAGLLAAVYHWFGQ